MTCAVLSGVSLSTRVRLSSFVIDGDLNTLTSCYWQTFVFAGRVMTVSDMLKILTGTRSVLPGFSNETILGQIPIFVPSSLS